MRVGDLVEGPGVIGTLIRIHTKTQDLLIRDSDGDLHVRLMASCATISNPGDTHDTPQGILANEDKVT